MVVHGCGNQGLLGFPGRTTRQKAPLSPTPDAGAALFLKPRKGSKDCQKWVVCFPERWTTVNLLCCPQHFPGRAQLVPVKGLAVLLLVDAATGQHLGERYQFGYRPRGRSQVPGTCGTPR